MIQQHRPLYRALLIAACSAALFITACKKPLLRRLRRLRHRL